MADIEARAIAAFEALGVLMTNTCINYQTILPPVRGEHLAFGDTGVVIYSNSVHRRAQQLRGRPLGAGRRPDRPHAALRLSSRRSTAPAPRISTLTHRPRDLADWGALGGIVGTRHQQLLGGAGHHRPRGSRPIPTSSSISARRWRASARSRCSTCRASRRRRAPSPTPSPAAPCRRPPASSAADFEAFYAAYAATGDKVDVVVFAAPQLSLVEMARGCRPARRPARARGHAR